MVNPAEYERYNHQPNFKPVQHLFEQRLRQFTDTGGQYHQLNLPKFYDKERVEIGDLKSWRVPDKEGVTQRPLFKDIDFDNVQWDDIGLGYNFGPSWKTFWVKFHIDIPESWLKDGWVEIDWDSSSEALIYDKKGLPLQAFTGGGERTLFKIPHEYLKAGSQLFYIEVACNGMFGNGAEGSPDPNRYFRLNRAHLVLPNLDARRLYWDFWILGDAARELPGNSWQKHQAREVCNEIMDVFDPDDVASVKKGRKLAEKLLGDKFNSEDVFDEYPNAKTKRVDVFAIGNCHIDTAWEWPFAETKRKIVRSWTTQIKLADQYPDYVFVASQMQQFKWLKQYHPEIFSKVKDKFATNQFIPVGGSWVENDTNLPNGESLIRQFLLGQRFQYSEFGFYSNVFWLPDTFGYSSQIPQICQQVGITRFLTQKLSWNNINSFPLSTFNWKALDGSQVLVHMPPANTYTAAAHFGDVVRSSQQHKNLEDVPAGLLLYGHGDGGGGPSEEMIEKIRRCRGLANTTGAIPSVHLNTTVDDFYEHILDHSNQGADLPTWVGEIYLEFHRGTYTTQAKTKKLVRFGEIKLHDLELVAGLISATDPSYKYPAAEIQALWEDLCLCQFHDVIPGSCIGMVYYEEVLPMLTKNLKKTNQLLDDALEHLGDGKKTKVHDWHFVNTLPWARNELLQVSRQEHPQLFSALQKDSLSVSNAENTLLVSVTSENGQTKLNAPDSIAYPASVKENDDGYVLSNNLLRATISKNGVITSLYDIVNDREVIDTTATKQTNKNDTKHVGGNQFLLFDDEPLNFPAWDTELYSLNKFSFVENGSVSILTNTKLEASLLVKHEISLRSSIETVISIQGLTEAHDIVQNNFVKFKSHVKWHETYKFLKVQFPTTIHSAQQASYETQFGITQRPTHFNTSWDVAKFEVAHHKFMDLSESNYGVSVLNNSKYGGAIHGNLIRLSLLRSAKAPDDQADMGDQDFEYALYPHAGSLGPDTVKLGYNFNYKLDKIVADSSKKVSGLLNAVQLKNAGSGLVLSHIKRGENDADVNQYEAFESESKQKSLVFRVYDSLGGVNKGTLEFDLKLLKVDKVFKTNALEDENDPNLGAELKVVDNKVDFKLGAFEIGTFKAYLK
ncbi:glycoside hydrolase family 38 protein [Suhomyces tanzawaensis NRRL Y-17324]|uniref:Alpha-mannosidase n=1 Tax=Suhomyces tanzawaensis NRRL Y-17324 TaxID=984487 RepID=A0A1E4SM86_9ASCO|nr:glycoside hydrolase family 38 protein [Suhomyces tanzawaensis NRRL Y-17324]ODV80623.1 glycoside hydrolase family 38 protein [Suhomyces tanzawaensis NRRL Y-17324]